MITWTLAFVAGLFLSFSFPHLPSPYWSLSVAIVSSFSWRWMPRVQIKKIARLLFATSLGFSWMVIAANPILHQQLPSTLEGKTLTVQGVIASIPQVKGEQTRFIFHVKNLPKIKTMTARLSWYGPTPVLHVGDTWQLQVRMKRPHGLINPGGFDYEAWLFQHGINATGYVVSGAANQVLQKNKHDHVIDRLREKINQNVQQILEKNALAGMISALTVGMQSGITQEQWEVLRQTGTNHLMAISGLHISLVAGLMYLLIGFFWRLSARLPLWIATPRIAALGGLLAAFAYSALAGFAVPTQRALVMLAVYLGAQILRRHVPPWHSLFLALFIVVFLDPLAILSASCWLSFGAVGSLIYGLNGRLKPKGLWWKWGRAQWVVSLALIPIGLYYFQQASFISPLANTIAIPWVSFTVVPLSLIGAILSLISIKLATPILWLAIHSLDGIWWILEKLSGLHFAAWSQVLSAPWIFFAGLFGVALLLAPRGYPGRYLGCIALLPLVFIREPTPAPGEIWLTVLDVGQGLATVVRTQHHTLVFDTGPSVGGMDAGAMVVVPYLQEVGVKKIDELVISHADNDHAGGAQSVFASLPVFTVISGQADHFTTLHAQPCLAGLSWLWDGIKFEFLYPPSGLIADTNNAYSCVLKISTGEHSLLLPGDIEKEAEMDLLRNQATNLKADILVAPHHGSRTSSTPAFIAAVAPQYVVYATGYRNKFRFPSSLVTGHYQAEGSLAYNTAYTGALLFKIKPLGSVAPPREERAASRKFWRSE